MVFLLFLRAENWTLALRVLIQKPDRTRIVEHGKARKWRSSFLGEEKTYGCVEEKNGFVHGSHLRR